MPAPLVDPSVHVGQLPWFPILRARLFGSFFNAHATNAEWRAGVTLWIKSYDERPIGSLPNDDGELWRLAAIKGNMRTWRRIKPMVLHGWVLCDDDRFYHPLIATILNAAKPGASLGQTLPQSLVQTKREHPQKRSARGNLKIIPPLNPPQGDFLLKNGDWGQPGEAEPRPPLDPRMRGHSQPCHCAGCLEWAAYQRGRTATGGD